MNHLISRCDGRRSVHGWIEHSMFRASRHSTQYFELLLTVLAELVVSKHVMGVVVKFIFWFRSPICDAVLVSLRTTAKTHDSCRHALTSQETENSVMPYEGSLDNTVPCV